MSLNRLSWDRIIELALMFIVVIMTGVGVVTRIENSIAVLNNRMKAVEQDNENLARELGTYRIKVDELVGMHQKEPTVGLHEKKYFFKRVN